MTTNEEILLPGVDRGGPLGMSLTQSLLIAGGVLSAGILVVNGHYRLTIVIIVLVAILAAPLNGVLGYQWLRTITRVLRLMMRGKFTYSSRAHLEGYYLDRPRMLTELSKVLGGRYEIAEFPYRDGGLAALHNRDNRTLTATFLSTGSNYLTQDGSEQLRRMKVFKDLLDELGQSGNRVSVYQWTHRTTPADSAEQEQIMRSHLDPNLTPADELALSLYAAAATQTIEGATLHHVEQVLGVRPPFNGRFNKEWRLEGGGLNNLFRQLEPHIDALVEHVAAMGVMQVHPLSRPQLDRQLELVFSPHEHLNIAHDQQDDASEANRGDVDTSPWPTHIEEPAHGRFVIVNGSYCRTFFVPGYSKLEISPHHLASLLNVAGVTRAVTVVARPVSILASAQTTDINRTIAKARSDKRAQDGTVEKKGSERTRNRAERRASQLEAGATSWAWSSYVTVYGDSEGDLKDQVAKVRKQARESRIRLVSLWGQQLEGLTYTAPLGRGR